jgi:hypothetical protein
LAVNPTAFPEVNSLVAEIADRAQLELGDNLLALYLYGSATTGGFNPDLSDVDLLAVTKVDIDQATAAALERMHDDLAASHPTWHDRIEVQYVSAAALADFRRRESWIGAISPGEPFHLKEAGGDWVQNWFDVQQNGVALLGPPGTFIPHISRRSSSRAVRPTRRLGSRLVCSSAASWSGGLRRAHDVQGSLQRPDRRADY